MRAEVELLIPAGAHARVGRTARRAAWALAALVTLGVAPRRASGQLSVDQVELFLEPRSLASGSVSFNVANESEAVVEAIVYLNDWDRTESGEHRFLPSGQLPTSCTRYLRVFPLNLRLPAHSSQAVRVALEGADSLTTACWSIVFVETAATPPAAGRQVTYITRLGVKVYVEPSGLTREGEIAQVQLRPAVPGGGGRELTVLFRNAGGMPLWPHGRVEFRRLDNSVASSVDVPQFPVLPGAARRLALSVPTLPSGRYVALALIDYGGSEIAGGQTELEVP